MRDTGEQPPHAAALFSRRHIDLQRVAGALCPGEPAAALEPARTV